MPDFFFFYLRCKFSVRNAGKCGYRKKQTKAELTVAVLKCKCYSLNFQVRVWSSALYITFCPNLARCQGCFMVVQLLQSGMPICIPGVSFDYFYLRSSKTGPDLSFHLAMSRVNAVSSFQKSAWFRQERKVLSCCSRSPLLTCQQQDMIHLGPEEWNGEAG